MDTQHSPATHGAGFIVTCAQCGKQAPSSRAYCGGCGARLWEPCLDCETSNSVAEQFCSRCGTDLHRQLAAVEKSVDEKLAAALKLEQEGKLLDAVEAIADIVTNNHSRMAARFDTVRRRREELTARRLQAISERGTLYEAAVKLKQEQNFAAAFATLERIPASLRDQETRRLIAELEGPLSEINELRGLLAKALKTSQPEIGLPHAERLVVLEPHAEDVRRVCLQLRERKQKRDTSLVKQILIEARDAIAKNDYASAGALLNKSPKTTDEDDAKMLSAIEERVWISHQLKLAPYADETLRGIAARLVKLQPKDKQAAKLDLEITTRLARAENRGGRPFVPWARTTGPSRFGPPVEPISNVAKIHWQANDPQLASWIANLRRHMVGLGLALTGLGAAKLDLEFEWAENTSWLGRLTGGGRRKSNIAWGLDFGSSGLKFVRLSKNGEVISVDRSGIIAYPQASPNGEPLNLQPLLVAALEQFRTQQAPGDDRIVVSFPGAQSLGKFFTLPSMSAKKLSAAIDFEVGNQIPLPTNEVVYDAHLWEPPAQEKASSKESKSAKESTPRQIVLAAAKKTHVALRMSAFDERKAKNCSLQSECIALLNVVLHCHADQIIKLAPEEAIALVDVGDSSTNVVAVSPARGPWFRALHHGARSFNRPLVDTYGITWQQAQQMRQSWPGQRPMVAVDRLLAPAIDELTSDVRRALTAYTNAASARITRIYVTGGGCNQFGLLREWSREAHLTDLPADGLTGGANENELEKE